MNIVSTWNSLEIIKLIISTLTPIIVIVVGIYIHRLTKRFEYRLWLNQKLIEKRLAIYDELAPLMNDNLCYFTYVGTWKERTPNEVVLSKRGLDKKIYLAAPLFSPDFFEACMRFQDFCFETYTGWGGDAKLKTQMQRRQQAFGKNWKQEWNSIFSDSISDPKEIQKAYTDVMTCFSREIGVNDEHIVPTPGQIPSNIR
jgi:uncharacterized membrane-anchored protein YhcB (DUF1043 family)